MNLKLRGIKRSWPNLVYYPTIFSKGAEETREELHSGRSVSGPIFEPGTSQEGGFYHVRRMGFRIRFSHTDVLHGTRVRKETQNSNKLQRDETVVCSELSAYCSREQPPEHCDHTIRRPLGVQTKMHKSYFSSNAKSFMRSVTGRCGQTLGTSSTCQKKKKVHINMCLETYNL
jgi:hypothetical protein